MQYSSSSKFGAFLETYNRNNKFLDEIANNYLDRMGTDATIVATNSDGTLKYKANNLVALINDKSLSSYDKLVKTGIMLDDIVKDIRNAKDIAIKGSGNNLIRSFIEVAKQTEDQQLLNTAVKIAKEIS